MYYVVVRPGTLRYRLFNCYGFCSKSKIENDHGRNHDTSLVACGGFHFLWNMDGLPIHVFAVVFVVSVLRSDNSLTLHHAIIYADFGTLEIFIRTILYLSAARLEGTQLRRQR
jgi:hypothetical protein